jgi:hypothetical protein
MKSVLNWFSVAKKCGRCGINLYYKPAADYFESIITQVFYKSVNLTDKCGVLEYNGELYQIQSGSGDCEENLYYIGKTK